MQRPKILSVTLQLLIGLSMSAGFALSGCLAAAAGAGAEAGYILSQDDRTAGETIDDQRITASIKSKMLADPEVSSLDINVDTMRRDVTLKGLVKSDKEASRAVELAQDVSGVKSVSSKLVVDN